MAYLNAWQHGAILIFFLKALAVRLSVRLSHAGAVKMVKRMIMQTSHMATRYPRDSSFLKPKISVKIERGHPMGAPNAGGVSQHW